MPAVGGTVAPDHAAPTVTMPSEPVDPQSLWTWSTRHVYHADAMIADFAPMTAARPGNAVVVRVDKVGSHKRIYSAGESFTALYPGHTLVGVLGRRYATDKFHAPEIDLTELHLLTNAGLIGTVHARHASMKTPTFVKLLGHVVDKQNGGCLNLKHRLFQPLQTPPVDIPLVLTVGTGMSTGKTTTTARVGEALIGRGLRVALLKVTGSVSHRDLRQYEQTGAPFVRDFSDYGFPSTYLCPEEELLALFVRMVHDAAETRPDAIVAEIADGVFQREVQLLLRSKLVHGATSGIILTATCAPSALALVTEIAALGYSPIAVSGLITNSPLFVEEFQERSTLPVLQSTDGCVDLAAAVIARLRST